MELITKFKKINLYLKKIGAYEVMSLLLTLIFSIYNLYLGIFHEIVWNYGVSFYYFLSLVIKLISTIALFKSKKKNKEYPKSIFVFSSLLLILTSLSMITPAILMIYNLREVDVDYVPSIIIACFVTVRVILLVAQYKNSKNNNSLYDQEKLTLNTVSTIFSVLTLQNTLIAVNGGADIEMTILSEISTFVLLFFVFVITIISLFKGLKKAKAKPENTFNCEES